MDDEIRDNEEITKDNVQPNDEAASDNDMESGGDDAAADTSAPTSHSDYKPVNRFDASAVHHLSGSSTTPRTSYLSVPCRISRTD